ncbi:MAG: alanyl-tRNA editing protein, partial [Bacteroidales bacterium]|nr:alanyl-tRNA editing protein [Bacteroidales bacterium]
MTEILYLENAYLKEIEAIVTHVLDNGVILDKTIFYPGGGGQPEDKGLIISDKEYSVKGFDKNNRGMVHLIEKGLSVGDIVTLKIDWEYRYQLMRHHTALHLLSAVVNDKFENTKVTGGNIHVDRARLDFDLLEFKKDMAQTVIDDVKR